MVLSEHFSASRTCFINKGSFEQQTNREHFSVATEYRNILGSVSIMKQTFHIWIAAIRDEKRRHAWQAKHWK